MFIKKDIWDLVPKGPSLLYSNPALFLKELKEDCMAIDTAQQIIQEDVNNQITFNIIDLKNFYEI